MKFYQLYYFLLLQALKIRKNFTGSTAMIQLKSMNTLMPGISSYALCCLGKERIRTNRQ